MRKLFILSNPVSGKQRSPKVLKEFLVVVAKHGLDYQVFLTEKDKNGWRLVEENLDESFTDLIILGGDGTINEAVNGLKYDIPVSILPCGSGNDYVKCLDLGKSLKEQMETALSGQIIKVDVGICNGRKFLNGVGVGFDGQIVADLATKQTWVSGATKYYYHVLRILSSYQAKAFSYQTDKEQLNKNLILLCVAKGTTFGGAFKLVPHGTLDDGKLHVCEIGNLSPLRRFLNILRLSNGSHTKLKEVKIFDAACIALEAQPQLYAHIDGEYFGQPPFKFKLLSKALQIRVRH